MTGLPSSAFYCLWNLAEIFGEVTDWRHRCVFRPNTVF